MSFIKTNKNLKKINKPKTFVKRKRERQIKTMTYFGDYGLGAHKRAEPIGN